MPNDSLSWVTIHGFASGSFGTETKQAPMDLALRGDEVMDGDQISFSLVLSTCNRKEEYQTLIELTIQDL